MNKVQQVDVVTFRLADLLVYVKPVNKYDVCSQHAVQNKLLAANMLSRKQLR